MNIETSWVSSNSSIATQMFKKAQKDKNDTLKLKITRIKRNLIWFDCFD